MITSGSKFFYGLGAAALVAAALFGWGTGGGLSGVLTVGLDGGVGNHTGLAVLLAVAAAAFLIGGVATWTRDADAEAQAQAVGATAAPAEPKPNTNNYWPAIGALGTAATVLGLVISPILFCVGIAIVAVSLLEWMIATWAERLTGDPEVNRRIRNRLMLPFEAPIFGALAIAAVVLAMSRIFLALSKTGSVVFGAVAGTLVFVAGIVVANTGPKVRKQLAGGLLALAALTALAGGVWGAAEGSRAFHPHETHDTEIRTPDRNQKVTELLLRTSADTTDASAAESSTGQ